MLTLELKCWQILILEYQFWPLKAENLTNFDVKNPKFRQKIDFFKTQVRDQFEVKKKEKKMKWKWKRMDEVDAKWLLIADRDTDRDGDRRDRRQSHIVDRHLRPSSTASQQTKYGKNPILPSHPLRRFFFLLPNEKNQEKSPLRSTDYSLIRWIHHRWSVTFNWNSIQNILFHRLDSRIKRLIDIRRFNSFETGK